MRILLALALYTYAANAASSTLLADGSQPPPIRPAAWVEPYNPLPFPNSTVLHGPARFTVISPYLIRMEFSPHTPPASMTRALFLRCTAAPRPASPPPASAPAWTAACWSCPRTR